MSEKRLIDANVVLKRTEDQIAEYEHRMPDWSPNDYLTSGRDSAFKWGFMADGVEKAMEIINEAPTIDAVPVVRCKDCEWWTKQKGSIQGRCEKLEIYPTGEWFCANGEKRGADNA